MAPLARNANKKNKSRKIPNKQLKVSQTSNNKEKKKTNNKNGKLKKICKGQIDIIKHLPMECSQEIMLYLPKNDVASAWNCSRDWKNVMSGNYFWKKRCRLDDYHVTLNQNEKSKFYHQYIEKFDYYYQGLYSYYQMLFNNWKNNNFKKAIRNCSVDNLHYFDENILIISSKRNKLVMIDSSTGNKIKTKLSGHEVTMSEVFKFENFLVSLSYNRMIKVWDLSKNGICISTKILLYSPTAIGVSKNVIACANMFSSEIFIYDFKGTHINTHTLNYGEFIRFVCIEDNIMAIGTHEGNVYIVEFSSKNLARHICSVIHLRKIMVKNGYLLCVLYTGVICVYNIETMTALHSFRGSDDGCPLTFLNENKLVANREDRRCISIWDFATGETLLQIRNQYVMRYLASNSRFVVAKVPYERVIKVWCCKTRELLTQISFSAIGLKEGHTIIHAYVTDSKLALQCYPGRGLYSEAYLVLLNFENSYAGKPQMESAILKKAR